MVCADLRRFNKSVKREKYILPIILPTVPQAQKTWILIKAAPPHLSDSERLNAEDTIQLNAFGCTTD